MACRADLNKFLALMPVINIYAKYIMLAIIFTLEIRVDGIFLKKT